MPKAYRIYFSENPDLRRVYLDKDEADKLYRKLNDPRFKLEEFDTDELFM